MGLLTSAAIIAVVAILVMGGLIFAFHKTASTKVTAQSAQALVVNDIKAQNPNANVSVISVSNSTISASSWQVVASVIYNGSKPCPTLFIDIFDYPAFGLQNYTDNLYSSGGQRACVINGFSNAPSYVISSPEIAIARSYTSNNLNITSYVGTYGYNNTNVGARFLTQSSSANLTYSNAWLVRYNAPNAKYSLYAVLDQNWTISETYNSSN
jgi:hypothetical protein